MPSGRSRLPDAEFCDHVCDLLGGLGSIRVRAMFGGVGIYGDGLMFALIHQGVLYLRTDAVNRPAFEARGLSAFRPLPDRPAVMPYHPVPDDALEDTETLLAWARPAYEAALRARSARPPSRRLRSRPSHRI